MEFTKYLSKGIQSVLDTLPIEVDKLRFTTDTGRIFLDLLNGTRLEFSDFVKSYTEEEILNILTPLPKVYISSDTHKLFIHDGKEWIICGEANKTQSSVENATYATNASTAEYAELSKLATNASTAEYSKNAATADYVKNAENAINADKAMNADTATYSPNAGTAVYADSANKATYDANGKQINTHYAPLNSPVFSGTPTVPTASSGSNNTQIANTKFVSDAILAAIGNITGFNTDIVSSFEELPETGINGTIYFVANGSTDTDDNIYDEYIWVNNKYETIGSTKINLSGYVNGISITGTGNAITNASVDENGNINFKKDASFLTEHPNISSSASTYSEQAQYGGTVEVIDGVVTDDNGHIISYRKKSLKFPESVANAASSVYCQNAGTATYATNASTAIYADSAKNATNASTANYAKNSGSATYANNSGTASYASNALKASNADTASYAKNAGTSTYTSRAGTATYADNGASATYSSTATYAKNAGSATNASTANYSNISNLSNGVNEDGDFDFGDLDG